DCVCSMLSFFFSSRRRHTRFSRDWSSDVCSSDLENPLIAPYNIRHTRLAVSGAGVVFHPPAPEATQRLQYFALKVLLFHLRRRRGCGSSSSSSSSQGSSSSSSSSSSQGSSSSSSSSFKSSSAAVSSTSSSSSSSTEE